MVVSDKGDIQNVYCWLFAQTRPEGCMMIVAMSRTRYSDTDAFTSLWCAVKWPSNYHLLIEHIINQMHLEEPQNQCSGFSQ